MAAITEIAEKFFQACDEGKGWEVCKAYCQPDATFSAQAEPLVDIKNLQQYTDWMKGLLTFIPDGRYELKSLALMRRGTTSVPMASSTVHIPVRVAPARPRARVWKPTMCMSWSSTVTRFDT